MSFLIDESTSEGKMVPLFRCSIEFEYVDNTVEYTYSRSEMALSWVQICMAYRSGFMLAT